MPLIIMYNYYLSKLNYYLWEATKANILKPLQYTYMHIPADRATV